MQTHYTVSRQLLNTYLRQRNLSDKASFLRRLSKRRQREDFLSFCEDKGLKGINSTHQTDGVLFHGSQINSSTLMPNVSMGKYRVNQKSAFVYATDNPLYAIFLSLLHLRDGGASVETKKETLKLSVDLDFVNGPSKIQKGFIHVVPKNKFVRKGKGEYISKAKVDVLFTMQLKPEDLTVPVYIQMI